MRFIALNHYNDNSLFIGDFEHAFLGIPASEANVSVTNAGVTFLLLPKTLDLANKLKFAGLLHKKLVARFSHGLCAAIGAESFGVPAASFSPFYAGVKKVGSTIRTLHCGTKLYPTLTDGLKADDHITDLMPQNRILSILSPSLRDKQQPSTGWEKYENDLFALFRQAQEELQKSRKPAIPPNPSYERPKLPQARASTSPLECLLGQLIPAN